MAGCCPETTHARKCPLTQKTHERTLGKYLGKKHLQRASNYITAILQKLSEKSSPCFHEGHVALQFCREDSLFSSSSPGGIVLRAELIHDCNSHEDDLKIPPPLQVQCALNVTLKAELQPAIHLPRFCICHHTQLHQKSHSNSVSRTYVISRHCFN